MIILSSFFPDMLFSSTALKSFLPRDCLYLLVLAHYANSLALKIIFSPTFYWPMTYTSPLLSHSLYFPLSLLVLVHV